MALMFPPPVDERVSALRHFGTPERFRFTPEFAPRPMAPAPTPETQTPARQLPPGVAPWPLTGEKTPYQRFSEVREEYKALPRKVRRQIYFGTGGKTASQIAWEQTRSEVEGASKFYDEQEQRDYNERLDVAKGAMELGLPPVPGLTPRAAVEPRPEFGGKSYGQVFAERMVAEEAKAKRDARRQELLGLAPDLAARAPQDLMDAYLDGSIPTMGALYTAVKEAPRQGPVEVQSAVLRVPDGKGGTREIHGIVPRSFSTIDEVEGKGQGKEDPIRAEFRRQLTDAQKDSREYLADYDAALEEEADAKAELAGVDAELQGADILTRQRLAERRIAAATRLSKATSLRRQKYHRASRGYAAMKQLAGLLDLPEGSIVGATPEPPDSGKPAGSAGAGATQAMAFGPNVFQVPADLVEHAAVISAEQATRYIDRLQEAGLAPDQILQLLRFNSHTITPEMLADIEAALRGTEGQ